MKRMPADARRPLIRLVSHLRLPVAHAVRWTLLVAVALASTIAFGAVVSATRAIGMLTSSAMPPLPTTTTVTSSQPVSFTGDSVTFTATVRNDLNNPVTTGTVTFSAGPITLASNVPLNASGQAAFATSSLTEGTHIITAAYSGDVISANPSSGN